LALVPASLPCFLIEWYYQGILLVPLVIGINLLFAGLRLIYWGKGGQEKRRAARGGNQT
jgi:phosphatidylglycerophosphate synthase